MSDATAEIVMPAVSEAMEEGTLLSWVEADGATVVAGQTLAEIETDKATAELEAEVDGVLSHRVTEGETVGVGTIIAVIGSEYLAGPADGSTLDPGNAARAEPGAVKEMAASASPLARRIARERGIDLATVRGSGHDGRIVKADVEALAAEPVAAGVELDAESTPVVPARLESAKGSPQLVDLTRLQQAVSRRMSEAKATVPEFVLRVDVEMTRCVALRDEWKESAGDAPVPSINDMIVKAGAIALREHPLANGSYRDGRFELFPRVNVGFAVAGEGSLVAPTVFDADTKALGEIAAETRRLVERARTGQITAAELAGGTFTVSNLGMFGISSFTAIINSPQAAILAVGAIESSGVSSEEPAHRATLTLTCDHRILYGADAARFLGRIRQVLERPAVGFLA